MSRRLRVKEAALYLGLSWGHLANLRTAGSGPRFLKLGGRVLYDTRELDKWLDENTRLSTSDDPKARARRRRRRRFGDALDVRR